MKPLFTLTTSFAALALLSAPSLAQQQRVQDFTLPPSGTPTPTPEAEGPVDEAAGVTIPPRTLAVVRVYSVEEFVIVSGSGCTVCSNVVTVEPVRQKNEANDNNIYSILVALPDSRCIAVMF